MKLPDLYPSAPFGALLGLAPGNIAVYSSDYDNIDDSEYPDRHAFLNYIDGYFLGYKWQCVEFARRWLYLNKGYVFDDIAMAYDIFQLRHVRRLADNQMLPYLAFANGCKRPPEVGSLLIWDEGGIFERTGHVAVVTKVTDTQIYFVEQNVYHHLWLEGQDYSRTNSVTFSADDGYFIECEFDDTKILGWMIQTDDNSEAESLDAIDPALLNLQTQFAEKPEPEKTEWLNTKIPHEAAYVQMMHGHRISENPDDRLRYYQISKSASREIKHASNALHVMFMHATDYVLQDETRLKKFNIPQALWPKIKNSWSNRRQEMIVGRVDLTVSERGLKVYEYNADSASCLLECGSIQGQWAKQFNVLEGDDPGGEIFSNLVNAWKKTPVKGMLHILQDHDLEENYHALYMKSAVETAGFRCKILTGFTDLNWTEEGEIKDSEGELVSCVWKTWAWETALEQLRQHLDKNQIEDLRLFKKRSQKPNHKPQLADVLLHPSIMVHEPLWTVIPSNKAILPILWELFPNHQYLLNSQYELNEELVNLGYVSKPIAGRCGLNIAIVDKGEQMLSQTAGRFDQQDLIYQELFPLPNIEGQNVQINTFNIDGKYSGTCVRVDPSLIINQDSNILALRVVNDSQ